MGLSVTGSLLFNIPLYDIFIFKTNCKICNHADDNTRYFIAKNLSVVKSNLDCNFLIMHKWFYENHVVLNPGKFHYILTGNKSHDDKITMNELELKASNKEKLLGILIDTNLSFEVYIKSIA